MNKDLAKIYESMFVEMDQKVVDYLNDHKDKLPFDHIFGEDLRVYIPIHDNDMVRNIVEVVKGLKDFYGIDWETEEVMRKITLDPKYGKGEKIQKINIGKVIAASKGDGNVKKEMLNWIAKYKGRMKDAASGDSEYGIILSRAPIDVLRMSDFDNIHSCHAQKGDYFQCAFQEAISGGAIAYIVPTKDIQEIIKGGYLQNDEIFRDKQRNIKDIRGIDPLARLRIRRLTNDLGHEIAIPDKKVYGDGKIPGFYETLKGFIKDSQPTDLDKEARFHWSKRGGTYYDGDYPISELINKFYDKNINEPNDYYYHDTEDTDSEHEHGSTIKKIGSELDQNCKNIQTFYNGKMTNCQVSYDIDYGEFIYGTAFVHCSITITIPQLHQMPINFGKYDEDGVLNAFVGDYDGEEGIVWSNLLYPLKEAAYTNGMNVQRFSYQDEMLTMNLAGNNPFEDERDFEKICRGIFQFDQLTQKYNGYLAKYIDSMISKKPIVEFTDFYKKFTARRS